MCLNVRLLIRGKLEHWECALYSPGAMGPEHGAGTAIAVGAVALPTGQAAQSSRPCSWRGCSVCTLLTSCFCGEGLKNRKCFHSVFAGCRKAGVPEPICAALAPAVQCSTISFQLPCALSSPGLLQSQCWLPISLLIPGKT